MISTSAKVLSLKIGATPPLSFELGTRYWTKKQTELSFDIGDQTGHLFADCDASELLAWIGGADESSAISASLGALDGSFAQAASIVLHFHGEGGRLLQSLRIKIGAGKVEQAVLVGRPAGMRISLRVQGKGTFRAIPIFLQTESREKAAARNPAAFPGPTAKCVVLQVESVNGAGAADTAEPAASPWLESVPDNLREELRSIASRSRARTMTRLAKRLQNEVDGLRKSWQSRSGGSADAAGHADRQEAVNAAVEVALAAASRTRQALAALEREVETAVRPAGADRQSSDLGDLQRVKPSNAARAEIAAEAATLIPTKGLLAAVATCLNSAHANDQAALMEMLGDAVSAADPAAAMRSYWLSWAHKQTPQRATTLAAKMFKAGDISSALILLKVADPDRETTVIHSLKVAAEIAQRGITIPARRAVSVPAIDDLAYVAAASQPFQTTGYTVRTQELLAAMDRLGTILTCYVRPGYPVAQLWQDGATEAPAERYRVGQIPYVLSEPGALEFTAGYYETAAASLVQRFRERPPRLVQAASNHRNALPALIAARTVGVPFVYEVRGLWELTAASKNPNWESTERFRQDRQLELTVASSADQVLVITQGVADELIASGVNEARIALLPNGVDPEKFKPLPFDEELANSLGIERDDCVAVYAGSLVNYEGLDDVISAIGILREGGIPGRLIIVGDGAMREMLQEQARSTGLSQWVDFIGLVPPEDVVRYISIAGMIPIARKPFKVCEVVSPLKPFEAMAMAKPVIVSNLPALREIVTDGETGLICEAASPNSLAQAMSSLHRNRDLAARIGDKAREWIIKCRSWDAHAAKLQQIYGTLS